MTQKYHIDKNGIPAICNATKRPCPLGGDEAHFDTYEEAYKAAQANLENQYDLLATDDSKYDLLNPEEIEIPGTDKYVIDWAEERGLEYKFYIDKEGPKFRREPFDDDEKYFDTYQEALIEFQRRGQDVLSLKPENIDPEVRKEYDDFWQKELGYYGDVDPDENSVENYGEVQTTLGAYEGAVTYYFQHDGKNVYFVSEDDYSWETETIAKWPYDEFVDISTQMPINTLDGEPFIEALLQSLGRPFEHSI